MTDEKRSAAWATCGKCGRSFVWAYPPMPLMTAAAMMRRVQCPYCGANSHRIYAGKTMPPPREGTS